MSAQLKAHDAKPMTVWSADGSNMARVPVSAQKCKLFVMTSHENHAETVSFFDENDFFGGNPD